MRRFQKIFETSAPIGHRSYRYLRRIEYIAVRVVSSRAVALKMRSMGAREEEEGLLPLHVKSHYH